MIQGKILSFDDDLSEIKLIRQNVFVNEKGIPEEIEFDHLDRMAIHAIAYELNSNFENKRAVATGRLIFDGELCQIDKTDVLKEHRGRGYGDFIIKLLLNKAFVSGINEVTVDTETSEEGFFLKLGFQKVQEKYVKSGIERTIMTIKRHEVIKLCNSSSKLYGV